MDQSCISIRNVGKQFAARNQTIEALRDVNLEVQPNEFITFVGASGCGKSTLLRIMAGLETHSSGDILLRGEPIDGPGVDRAMVFQHYSLYPWLTVTENIKFCRQLKVIADSVHSQSDVEAASGRADALLNLMGLKNFAGAYPSQLSGGMQQRVAIARALMPRPDFLLMDEPFGALDAQTREVMHDLILHVHRLEKSTILFVTHDVEEAIYLGTRIVLMAPRPGRIDSVYEVPLPKVRHQDMKLEPEFIALKREILTRIRETSGVQTDLDQLARLSEGAVL
ncbi:MAG: sulfonate ABC transporter ATP-binding protein [Pseudomonadales bacterium]|jgi:NitT/TauT family transport system ATP-binding protein|uniref:ABC transporter ATP-binding protein n=1 Tax=Halopseudomonas TaxID=2901189 RepID=UPI000C433269|nr:ABC transporter ATP-binding protein [Halopseudomonas aestusnigri]MAH00447.1 sulfonate ABC transporter ATP-binding protein [Pseudomonadales bacterium]MEE2799019.1 ABC transporter ATP-binding protein [Pseudomonadota bacterium]HBT57546.1 sulfonate ABC transporter ATP-binding protein [Pseudomonas sp.]MAK75200.1 sulfonate ABC transporter ATP-binding protein [Pseudomonadales bacterium]MAP77099.1 sulfonate ABC transporter ATP-binding protein [Pseudomonadales bacterium]|tara:strand:+ start:891 stop:1733 length:843 start_codon:yes stop_codon:yes gene_type:complete